MYLNKQNYKYLFINYKLFNINNIYFEYDLNKDFININYLDVLDFEGLYLVTPLVKPINKIKLIDDNFISKKYIIELPLIGNDHFYQIFSSLDDKVINFFNSDLNSINNDSDNDINERNQNNININNESVDESVNETSDKINQIRKKNILSKNNNYIQNIKINNYKYRYKYENIKIKVNSNNCVFYYNDKLYEKDIMNLNIDKMSVKCNISCHGLWKFNNTYGMTWRCLSIYFYDNVTNEVSGINQNESILNIDYYLNNNYLKQLNNNENIYDLNYETEFVNEKLNSILYNNDSSDNNLETNSEDSDTSGNCDESETSNSSDDNNSDTSETSNTSENNYSNKTYKSEDSLSSEEGENNIKNNSFYTKSKSYKKKKNKIFIPNFELDINI